MTHWFILASFVIWQSSSLSVANCDTLICASVMASHLICYISHTLHSDSNPVVSVTHWFVPAHSSHFIPCSTVRFVVSRNRGTLICASVMANHLICSFHIPFTLIRIQSHLRRTDSYSSILRSPVRCQSQLWHTDLCSYHGNHSISLIHPSLWFKPSRICKTLIHLDSF